MGRMKEVYMQILEANEGIPEELTLSEFAEMQKMEIYNWQEYERAREKNRIQQYQSENSGEAVKIEQIQKKFSSRYGEAREKKD
jgi:hypothetical protein